MTKTTYDLGESKEDFLGYIEFFARDAMQELLDGKSINPYHRYTRNRYTRDSLRKYADLGLISKFGTRYPNIKFSLNPESQELEQWHQLCCAWKALTQKTLKHQSSLRVTVKKLDRLAELVESKSAYRFGVCLEAKIINGIRRSLVVSERPLPKKLFKKITFLNQNFYTITETGALRFLQVLSSYVPLLLDQSKATLEKKRRSRIASRTRSVTLNEKERILRKIGFCKRHEYWARILPEKIAIQQARWECFHALRIPIITMGDSAHFARMFDVNDSTIRYALRTAKQPPPIELYLSDQKELYHLSRLISMRELYNRT